MAILGTDLLLVGRGSTNFKITASALATFIGGGGGGGVTGVGVTAPITDSGTATAPIIGISPATPTDAGSLSAADKVKIDALPSTIVASITGTAPIQIGGTASIPNVTIDAATDAAPGAVELATAAEAAAGIDADRAMTPSVSVPKVLLDMTGAAIIPGGTDAQRAAITAPAAGMLRYNSQGGTPVDLEYYDGAAWTQLATGGGGGTLFAFATFDAGFTVLKSANFASITVTTTAPGFYPNLYTATFTNSPPDANYAVLVTSKTPTVIGNYFTTTTSGFQMTFNAIGTGIITNVTSPFSVAVII
jgi:hypothetical protein